MCVGVGFVATKRERIMNGSVWLVMSLLRVGIGVAATSLASFIIQHSSMFIIRFGAGESTTVY